MAGENIASCLLLDKPLCGVYMCDGCLASKIYVACGDVDVEDSSSVVVCQFQALSGPSSSNAVKGLDCLGPRQMSRNKDAFGAHEFPGTEMERWKA